MGAAMVLGATAGLLSSSATQAAAPWPGGATACGRHEVVEQVRTDHRRYQPGQPVKITVKATNTSHHDCTQPSIVHVQVRRATGPALWQSAVAIDWIQAARWPAGKSITWSFTWNQQDCSSGTCSGTVSPGTYFAEGAWGSYPSARARLIVNGIR
jgi:hypothetical protein